MKLYIIIGAYGSGKSEYAINLAKMLKVETRLALSHQITLVDLDVVNPYFRSRDVRDAFEKEDIEVIAPEFQYGHADVPMISPRIRGAIQNLDKTVILDVGGDPAGCKALGRFVDDINARGYEMHFVVNTKRPFTTNATDIITMKEMLEFASKLKITQLVCNTNLLSETTVALVRSGVKIVKEVAEKEGIAFEKYLVMGDRTDAYPAEIDGVQKVELTYFLSKPWEYKRNTNSFV